MATQRAQVGQRARSMVMAAVVGMVSLGPATAGSWAPDVVVGPPPADGQAARVAAVDPSGRFSSGPIHGAGFMTVLAELPSGRLVAGGDSQGFFVSDDGGRSWRSRNEIAGGADPIGSRGVASLVVADVTGPNGTESIVFAGVGKRESGTAAVLRSDDEGETWVVDNGGRGIWFDGGNLPGGGSTRSRATSRLMAVADRGPYAGLPHVFAGDMLGCVWQRPLVAAGAWSPFGCLPEASRSPIRSVAIGAAGDVIVATSRMGLAGSRGGGTLAQPQFAGAWRFAAQGCVVAPCAYLPPTEPLVLFGSLAQSVEELRITADDHLYAGVVDDRIVGSPTRLGGLWAGRPDGSALVAVSISGANRLRNVVSVDIVSASSSADTVLTGASLPRASTDIANTDFEVSRSRIVWTGAFPVLERLEPLTQDASVDLRIYGHDGNRWFVDGTSTIGNDQYVVSSVEVLRDGRYLVAGKAGIWVHDATLSPPWRPAVYGIGATFLGDVAVEGSRVFATDADRFLYRADLAAPDGAVRHELDYTPTVTDAVTKGLSVTVLADGTALSGQATATFGGVIFSMPPGDGPVVQHPLPVDRQPVALESVGDTVFVGIADSGLWAARWDAGSRALVEWRRITVPGPPPALPVTSQPFETAVAGPDDVAPASATVLAIEAASSVVLVTETASEGLWMAPWTGGATPLAWTQVATPASLPAGRRHELAYVRSADALFLAGIGTLSRIDAPARCVAEACSLAPVVVPVVDPAGWTPMSTSYGAVPIASDGDALFLVAGMDLAVGKPGTVYRYEPLASDWVRLADPDGVAANQLVRPIAVAADGGRLAVTTSGNGLVVYR